jgi:hypothetical protein
VRSYDKWTDIKSWCACATMEVCSRSVPQSPSIWMLFGVVSSNEGAVGCGVEMDLRLWDGYQKAFRHPKLGYIDA